MIIRCLKCSYYNNNKDTSENFKKCCPRGHCPPEDFKKCCPVCKGLGELELIEEPKTNFMPLTIEDEE